MVHPRCDRKGRDQAMSDLDDLVDDRSDPDARSVLEDLYRTRSSRPPTRLGLALLVFAEDDLDADFAVDEIDAATDTDHFAADFATDYLTIDAADFAAADAAAGYPADYAAARLTELLTKELDMHDGLKIIQIPGGHGWPITRVGWMRRVVGDEWELIGARTIIRRSGSPPRPLDSLASLGPGDDHVLTPVSEANEEIHRLVVRRSMPASLAVWGEHCPRPDQWQEDDP